MDPLTIGSSTPWVNLKNGQFGSETGPLDGSEKSPRVRWPSDLFVWTPSKYVGWGEDKFLRWWRMRR